VYDPAVRLFTETTMPAASVPPAPVMVDPLELNMAVWPSMVAPVIFPPATV